MDIEDYLKIHSDGSLLLVATDSFLIVETRPEPILYIDRLTISYGDDKLDDNVLHKSG